MTVGPGGPTPQQESNKAKNFKAAQLAAEKAIEAKQAANEAAINASPMPAQEIAATNDDNAIDVAQDNVAGTSPVDPTPDPTIQSDPTTPVGP